MAQDFATFRLVAVHERPPDLGGLGRTMITSGWGKNVDEICGSNVAKKPVIHLFREQKCPRVFSWKWGWMVGRSEFDQEAHQNLSPRP